MTPDGRAVVIGIGAMAAAFGARPNRAHGQAMNDAADLILFNGRITTLDRQNPEAQSIAIRGGRFIAVGAEQDVMRFAGPGTQRIDLKGRRVIPGLIDSHMHIIRGGLNYNMELRWDGVRSLADAMRMLKEQVDRTPAPQWVRVVGGFTEHQFAEKRLPTLDEINAIAPDTPVFLLHLYDRALLNAAALRAVGYTKDTPEPSGGEIVRDTRGVPIGLLLAKPNAGILYATLAKGPKLPSEYQLNSTRQFMRELNRLGVTGAIDAGGGSQNYPDDYAVIQQLEQERQLTIRLAYNLFTQKPKGEKQDFLNWVKTSTYKQGSDYFRHNGAGEMLVFSAADFEDFRQPRPDMPPEMERELEDVVRLLATNRWPWRLHATYDETISRALDVYERVAQDVPLNGLKWFFDHAETISDPAIDRIAALGGGIAVDHRMAYQGEYFVERYGAAAASATPPFARMLALGLPVSAGTDATRVASYNPWVSLSWLVTGKTVGGLRLYPERNCLDRETALRMWTENVAWFSNEEGKKGRIQVGHLADLIVPDRDYFSCPESEIPEITAHLTVVGGKIIYGAAEFAHLDEATPPPAMPDWSPVRRFGGLAARRGRAGGTATRAAMRQTTSAGGPAHLGDVHAFTTLWGALGCACWAV